MAAGGSILRSSSSGGLRLRSRRTLDDRLKAGLSRFGDWWNGKPRARNHLLAALAVLLAGGVAIAYLAVRPMPKPDYLVDDLDDVLSYTFLTDQFNKLPLDERLALVKDLVTRLKGMDSGDSALMAAFAAGIDKTARAQLQDNLERLGVDIWDDLAKRYEQVPEAERAAWMDSAYVEFTKKMEDLAGVSSNKSDQERLADGKKNAARGQEMARQYDRGMNSQFGGFIFAAISRGSGKASPAQQARMGQFSVDMTRHMRGQDIKTGRPR